MYFTRLGNAINNDLLLFSVGMKSRLGLISSKLEVPPESPFAGIGLGQPFLTISSQEMSLKVSAPEVVGQRKVEVIL